MGQKIMNSIETLATFFGWCTIINIGLIVFVFVLFSIFHEFFSGLTAKMFGVSTEVAKETVLRVFMQYRVVVLVLNLVPYIALKIMV